MATRKQLLDQNDNEILPITDTESVRNPQNIGGTLESRLGTFIKGVQQNGNDLTPDANGKVNVTVQDGQNGLSAFEIAQQQGYTGTVDQWLASLKANIGAFKFVSYDQSAESAFTTGGIGTTYSNTIDGLVAGTDTTPDVILLMNNTDGTTDPTKTFMIATQETTTAGTYEFIYAGDLQSAMPSNVLTENRIVNDLITGGVDDVLSAEQGLEVGKNKKAREDLTEQVSPILNEPKNWLDYNSEDIITGQYIKPAGDFANNSTYSISNFIPAKYGETYKLCTFNSGGTAIASNDYFVYGVNEYDANKQRIRTVNKGNGNSTYTPTDENVKYFRYCNTRISSRAMCYYGGAPSAFSEYFTPYYTGGEYYLKENIVSELNLQDNIIGESKLKDSAVSFVKISFKETVITSRNILNPDNIYNGFIDANGAPAIGMSYRRTGFIPINKKGLYFNHWYQGSSVKNWVYNPDKTPKRLLSSQYVFQEGDEGCFVRFSMNASDQETAQVEIGTSGTSYTPYSDMEAISPSVLPPNKLSEDDKESFFAELRGDKVFGQKIDIDLPDKIYAVRGDTLQLFYQGMLKCVNPENYNVVVSCKYGTQYHRYYEFVCPSNATLETRPLTITVKDNNGNVLGTKSTSLQIVKAPVSPSANKNILCIGDSLTAGGLWPAEANRRLKASDGTPTGNGISNITFVGRLSKEQGGETAKYEGKSGYGWKDFVEGRNPKFRFYIDNNATVNEGDVYSNNGYQYTVIEINTIEGQLTILTSTSNVNNIPQESGTLTKVSGSGDATITYTSMNSDSDNPLWDGNNNRISFQYYLETVCGYPTGTSLDAVYVMLSWNQISPNQTNWNTILGYIKTFADTLHSEFPTAKLKLMAVQYPSMKLMMPTYGANGGYGDIYGMLNTIYNMNQTYQAFANSTETSGTSGDAYNTFIEFVNVSSQVDSDNNMPISNKKVNTRNSATEPYANNGVHPGNSGYLQIADVAYRNIVANFCQ